MKTDVVILGGGFWGSATALRLEDSGRDYIIIDDANPLGASRNAAGICKLGWYKQATIKRMIDGVFTYDEFLKGFEWLGTKVPVKNVDEHFVNKMSGGKSSVHKDNYLGNPHNQLNAPSGKRITDRAKAILVNDDGSVVVKTAKGNVIEASQAVIALGAYTDDFLIDNGLPAVGIKKLPGRAILFRVKDFEEAPDCLTIMTRPYSHFTFRKFGDDQIRGGDTVERSGIDQKNVDNVIRLANDTYGEDKIEDVKILYGLRPVPVDKMVIRTLNNGSHRNVVVASGGHRVGWGLSGAASKRVMELLNAK